MYVDTHNNYKKLSLKEWVIAAQVFTNGNITVNLLPVIAAALALGACK